MEASYVSQQSKHLSRIESEASHTCAICQERIKIPCVIVTHPNDQCSCACYACMGCMIDYEKYSAKEYEPMKCIICKATTGNMVFLPGMKEPEYLHWMKDPIMASILDEHYKDTISCLDCEWKGSRMEYIRSHSYKCDEKIVLCPQKCDEKVKIKNMNTHLNNCIKNTMKCTMCHMEFTIDEVERHVCPEVIIPCRWCRSGIKQKDIADHEPQCREDFPFRMLDIVGDLNEMILVLTKRLDKLSTSEKNLP